MLLQRLPRSVSVYRFLFTLEHCRTGIAVIADMLLTTHFLALLMFTVWRRNLVYPAFFYLSFAAIELTFLSSALRKVSEFSCELPPWRYWRFQLQHMELLHAVKTVRLHVHAQSCDVQAPVHARCAGHPNSHRPLATLLLASPAVPIYRHRYGHRYRHRYRHVPVLK